MLNLFSIDRKPSSAAKTSGTVENVKASSKSEISESMIQFCRGPSDLQQKSLDGETPLLWPTKVGRTRLFSPHASDCECCIGPLPMQQSIDEMEWERGIWGLSNAGKSER